jgi:hypothetical protein
MNTLAPSVLTTLLLAGMAFAAAPVTWEAVQAEPTPEKQSQLALELALASVDGVVTAFHEGLPEQANAMSARIVEAAELSLSSLEDPGAHPKFFKKAEIAARRLVRSLKSAQRELNFDEREQLELVIERIEEINNQLLTGVMRRR